MDFNDLLQVPYLGYEPGSFLGVEDIKMTNAVFIPEAHCPRGSQMW